MRERGVWREILFGVLTALVSSAVILGSLSTALIEGGALAALTPTAAGTEGSLPNQTTPVETAAPGNPIYTASPTSLSTIAIASETPAVSCNNYPKDWVAIDSQSGETLDSLAARYGTSASELAEKNCLPNSGSSLPSGTTLRVPPPTPTATEAATETPVPAPTATPTGARPTVLPTQQCVRVRPPGWVTYVVRRGDTLSSLSQVFNVGLLQLKTVNCLENSSFIRTGEQLYVPNVATQVPPLPTATDSPTRTPVSTSTTAPTSTAVPTSTPQPTDTPKPTNTPPPTATNTPPTPPTEAPTDTPAVPTEPPESPTSQPTPLSETEPSTQAPATPNEPPASTEPVEP